MINHILQNFILISILNRTLTAPGRIFKEHIILYSEISVLNSTSETENSVNKTLAKGNENSTELEVEISKPLKSHGDMKYKINNKALNKKTEISSINIALTYLVISFHLFILLLIIFLIFKSNKEAERRIRIMLKYRPSKNWIEPIV